MALTRKCTMCGRPIRGGDPKQVRWRCDECKQIVQTDTWLRKNYGIGVQDFSEMKRLQHNKCAICLIQFKPGLHKHTGIFVDHNHTTGKARGLLCSDCNLAVGFLRDDPARASRLADYLYRAGERPKPVQTAQPVAQPRTHGWLWGAVAYGVRALWRRLDQDAAPRGGGGQDVTPTGVAV
jgi:endogenous inhibitor of DNA gyrase (YacG/DUF329 family)